MSVMRPFLLILALLVPLLLPLSGGAPSATLSDAPPLHDLAAYVAWHEAAYRVDMDTAHVETASVTLDPGLVARATYGPAGLSVAAVPAAGVPASSNESRIGCVASLLGLPAGWVAPGEVVCEPDVERRTWLVDAPQELQFVTSGHGVGGVNAVNFPDPFEPGRHGIFILWCEGAGAGTLDSKVEVTCKVLRIGVALSTYDHWTSHVGLSDGVGPNQALAAALWKL